MRLWFIGLALMGFFAANAQEISGRVVASGRGLSGVEVLNIVNEQSVKSGPDGSFTIPAKAGEMLLFYMRGFEPMRFSIDPEHFEQQILATLIAVPEMLDEVVVTYDINPESLGIVPKGQKKYTVAERRLYASQSGPLDGILNALNGKTAQRKNEVKAERALMRFDQLTRLFEPEYFTQTLQIPALYVDGFKYFVLDDADIISGLLAKNKARVGLRLTLLAPEYLKTIREPESQITE